MKKQVALETIKKSLVCTDPVKTPLPQLVEYLLKYSTTVENLPESHFQIDPRDGHLSIFSASRAKRVHTVTDYKHTQEDKPCPICEGNLTTVWHIQPLSEGVCFITENLYPVVHPYALLKSLKEEMGSHAIMRGGDVFGGHFLQWTSSIHENDWHNMPVDDLVLTMSQLQQLEQKFLKEAVNMPTAVGSCGETRGYLSVFKNFGAKAGASLDHGHQQILFSNVMSRGAFNDWRFYARHCETYTEYMLRENPDDLLVKDYGDVVLLVPYFMPRPYCVQVMVKRSEQSHLFQLTDRELEQLTKAMQDAIHGISRELTADGKAVAYNYTIHTGPGCGLYVDFIPRADAAAGLELQGVWVCQALPSVCAERLREHI